jgi:aminoglycoside 3-N-acetyltransferase
MTRRTVYGSEVIEQLTALGIKQGDVLVVHTAISRVKPVEGGPLGLIAALRAAVGPSGTVAMPSMSDDDDHPFDLSETPCIGMGVVANTFRQLPGVLRSENPHAFAATGPRAVEITAAHSLEVSHGLDSPVGRIYQLNGQVLLLGVAHDANTTVHLAEVLAGVRYRRRKHLTTLEEGLPTRFDYSEIDHCCENFNRMDQWLEAEHCQRRGTVGHAEARLISARDVVRVAMKHLREDETAFLHPLGVDVECDEARASLMKLSNS